MPAANDLRSSSRKVLLRGMLLTGALIALWLLPAASFAQRAAVDTELVAEIRQPVNSVQGTGYRFVRATVVPQGEVIYYTVKVRNPGSAYARSVVVVQKIPENTTYVAGSATGPAVDVSLSTDGGRTFAAERKVSRDRGAPAVTYTHIRWRFRNAIAPEATALARFQAVFR